MRFFLRLREDQRELSKLILYFRRIQMEYSLKRSFSTLILVLVSLAAAGCGDRSQKDAASYQEGVDAYSQGNFSVALEKLKTPAEHGNPKAQFYLGLMYRQGNGVAQNDKEAAIWWSKAAEQGNMEAQENLGLIYAKGLGVERDWVQADKWFSIAAASGKETAVNNKKTVELHMQPEGIAQANALAKDWLEKHKK
ncbi:MAG: tetratricopeptide repeat protein [Gallionella sp.]